MSKLVLKDGTEITNITDASMYEFSKQCENASEMAQIFDSLTIPALSRFELKDDEDNLIALYVNKKIKSCMYGGNDVATFYLDDIDATEQRLSALEDTVDMLVLSDMSEEFGLDDKLDMSEDLESGDGSEDDASETADDQTEQN